ncbi:TonB-dependent receptor [Pseudoalteromonas sp. MMG022]|uniref:TonB-dependent receptor plug domain-containing protein n=1 Tax=Pseudoalteromonas sp. MMG022 TaxID=2909978 RepID=UPI001F16D8A9|nr:TonB-dependent receptor [Pseudoalteromonas sp. MMG022]MCF6436210.1 TonB-dependent receptor [Pseudoalteromonas sp. MMG022]
MTNTPAIHLIYLLGVFTACNCVAEEDIYGLSLEELQNVTVTIATKTDTQLKYAPSTVSYFSRQDIRLLGIETLSELFAHIPGFYPMYNSVEGNQSYLITRGHPQKYANTLLVLVNGQRLNEDYTGGINYIDRFVSLHNVEKVEVIRGPGSTLYGSNAFNGVINIVTKIENNIAVAVGSFDRREISGGFNYQGDQLSFGVDARIYEDDGDTLGNVFDRFNIQTTTNDAHKANQLEAYLSYAGFTLRNHYFNSKRKNHYLFRRLRDGTTHVENKHWLSRLEYQNAQQQEWMFKAGLEYSKAKRKSLSALELKGAGPFTQADFLFGENFTHDSFRANIDYSYQLFAKHRVSAGLEFVRSQVPGGYLRSNYNIFGDLEYFGNVVELTAPEQRIILDNERRIEMVYVQLESVWNDQWRSTLGLRNDAYNDVADKTNPRATLIYSPNERHTFKLIYGQAYRVPSLGDLYDEESGLTIGNQNLHPTTIEALEFVYQFVGEGFSISTSLFRNDINDLIDFRVDGDNVFLDNIASNTAQGVEIDWQLRLFNKVQLKGFITHLFSNQTHIEEAQQITPSDILVPRTYSMTSLMYYPNKNWSISVSVNGRSAVEVLSDKDSNTAVSAAVNYQLSDNMSLSLDINNALDTEYSTSAIIPFGEKNNQPFGEYQARGRNVSLSYRYQF